MKRGLSLDQIEEVSDRVQLMLSNLTPQEVANVMYRIYHDRYLYNGDTWFVFTDLHWVKVTSLREWIEVDFVKEVTFYTSLLNKYNTHNIAPTLHDPDFQKVLLEELRRVFYD